MEHGEVFTRRRVVDLILDLLGYTADKDLCEVKLVDPACGSGAFLAAVTSRISASCRMHKRPSEMRSRLSVLLIYWTGTCSKAVCW
ncbi:N-6 DNA methylase [Streptomyces sp. NPDC058441]|uniref:N-6 DNA methylase n=1 Tax=Streptomyces sp. NPDC058441 TaxID=3346502 RepID=UPI0036685AFA